MSTFQSIEEAREYFKGDVYAMESGITLDALSEGAATCSFAITPSHRNAEGAVMGGAIFTLADFALAVASNLHEHHASVNSTIDFMSRVRGKRLVATCDAQKRGRTLSFYTVDVSDELGTPVARMSATCCRVG